MPVRDGARHLDEAVASILGQTLRDLELIVVDDGSSDGTPAMLDAWTRRDPRVHAVRQAAAGIVPALERARAVARAPYVARMDADDVALPERLERQHALLEAREDWVGCGTAVSYFPAERVRDGARRYERWINGVVSPEEIAHNLFVECPLPHPTFFLRANAVEAVGGYRDRGWPEDYDLILRLWQGGGRLGKVPTPLLLWREGRARLSRTHRRYAPEAFRRCKAHYLARTVLRGGRAPVIWGAGPVGKAFARALDAEGVAVRAFVDVDPKKVGQVVHGAPVVGPEEGVRMPGCFHLAAVGQKGARARIRALLEAGGLMIGTDFLPVA